MPDFRASLPGLPDDIKTEEGDRQHTWVVISAEGPCVMPLRQGEDEPVEIDVTPEWIAERVADYIALTGSGYYEAGHIVEHDRQGLRTGDVFGLSEWVDPRDKRAKLLAGIRWVAGIDARKATAKGELRFASPCWTQFTDELGKTWPIALGEVSAVVAPHQKSLAPSHYLSQATHMGEPDQTPANVPATMTEDTMPDIVEEPGEEAAVPLAERMDKMEANMAEIMNRLPEKKEDLAEDVEGEQKRNDSGGDKEEDDQKKNGDKEDDELSELRAELSEMKDLRKREQFRKSAHFLGECSDDVAEAAYKLSESNPAAFDAVVNHIGKTSLSRESALSRTAETFRWNMGSAEGAPDMGAKLSRPECAAKARAEGLDNNGYKALVKANGHNI